MQDKWLAHWLGRPSHIQSHQFRVLPLSIASFMNEWEALDESAASSTQSFVSLSHLTVVLSDIMDGLYSLNPDSNLVNESALILSKSYRSQLADWSKKHIFTPGRPGSQDPNSYAVIFAYYAAQASIQRGLSARQTDLSATSALADNMQLETLVEDLEGMEGRTSNGLWLSYCKRNIAIIGTFMISLLLARIDDGTFHFRRNLLLRYQRVLNDLSGKFEFAALPSLRLNLMLRNLFEPPDQAGDTEASI